MYLLITYLLTLVYFSVLSIFFRENKPINESNVYFVLKLKNEKVWMDTDMLLCSATAATKTWEES